MISTAVNELASVVGTRAACAALAISRATHYRRDREPMLGPPAPRPAPPRALSKDERTGVLDLLNDERFIDASPAQTYATLLDEGEYFASERTMYRILAAAGEVRERRNQRVHPFYARPELLASGPNQLWSWDITKLRGPVKWTYFQLYVILDVFSRYVTGWMVATRESAALAERLIADSVRKQGIEPDSLTIHADRGTSMTSKPVALLLADLGVVKSHSRPHVSNDNPYSEAGFKTAGSSRHCNESCEMNRRRSQEDVDAGSTWTSVRRTEAAGLPASGAALAVGGHRQGDRMHGTDGWAHGARGQALARPAVRLAAEARVSRDR